MAAGHSGPDVRPGQIWEVGPHALACGDGEAGAWGRMLDLYGAPDVIYSDPPWGASLATGYRTKAGVARRVNYPDFLAFLMQACRRALGDVWIEQGERWGPETIQAAAAAGLLFVQTVPIVYYKRRPALLIQFRASSTDAPVGGWEGPCMGADDTVTPGLCLRAAAAAGRRTVFDPCTGKGLTPLAAHAAGMRAIGVELGPHRLSAALERLGRATGEAPRLVGTL